MEENKKKIDSLKQQMLEYEKDKGLNIFLFI